MKKVLAIAIVVCLLVQCTASIGVWGWYQLNKDYIARNLCENRDKPMMRCCGKCQLRKRLKQVNETGDNKNTPNKNEKQAEVAYVLPVQQLPLGIALLFPEPSVQRPLQQQMYGVLMARSIFHPPGCVCL